MINAVAASVDDCCPASNPFSIKSNRYVVSRIAMAMVETRLLEKRAEMPV